MHYSANRYILIREGVFMKRFLVLVFAAAAFSAFPQDVPPIMVNMTDQSLQPNIPERLALTTLDVDVRISGLTAETELTMTFFNPGQIDIAGDLYVPLPENAVVSGYALDIDGVLVDGVPVEKQKGREVFEKIVRQGIDPGLAEWTTGNTFKTRVFPIPAAGSRTVKISYLSDLEMPGGVPVYHLPMNYSDPVSSFSIRVEVVSSALPPAVRESAFSNFRFLRWQSGFAAESTMRNAVLDKDLYISLPPADFLPVSVEKSVDGTYYFAVTDMGVQLRRGTASRGGGTPPSKITLYWDASGSRSASSLESSYDLLTSYFHAAHAGVVTVECIVFRNEAEEPVSFRIRDGRADELISFLRGQPRDGGTQIGSLPKPGYGSGFALLFSDGISNFGSSELPELSIPLYVFSDDTSANYPLLKYLAMKNNGDFFNLRTVDSGEAAGRIGRASFNFIGVRVDTGAADEIYPQLPRPVMGAFRVSGKLRSSSARLTLLYGRNGQAEVEHTFTVDRSSAVDGELLRLVWAQDKLNDLLIFPDRNAALISDLGKEYGIVTPGTSLIVLDSLDQYVEYRIPPPRMLADMRKQYFDIIARERKEEEDRQDRKIDSILALWDERVDWWKTEFTYPPDFRYGEDSQKSAESEEDLGFSGAEAPAAEPDMLIEEEAMSVTAREAAADEGGFEAEKKAEEPETEGGPVVEIQPWDPSTPYLEALKAEVPSTYYTEYLRQKTEYGSSPAFYLDCADFFFARGLRDLALRILSNLAELELENPALLRVLAHRLEQQDYLSLSRAVFEDVLRMRPEEPQSYRDLALVCGRLMEYERGVELLYRVILGHWDRFDRIEMVALMEMNNMIRKAGQTGKRAVDFNVDPRLVKMLDVDLRVVLTWDADLTDMDLWVIEPSGEKCYYGNNRTTIGGHLSRDFTDGYGPEEYMLRRAMDGTYDIKVDYFSSSAPALTGSVTLQAVVFTDYGRPNEKRQAITVRLRESDDVIDIGKAEF